MTPHTTHPVPAFITMALDVRGLEGPEVDLALGVAEPNGEDLGVVDDWETGHLIPTAAQLAALAELTKYPPSFFFQPGGDPVTGPVFVCPGGAVERRRFIGTPRPNARTSTGEPPATLRLVEAHIAASRTAPFSHTASAPGPKAKRSRSHLRAVT